ncbi:MAG: Rrf2 family transcriptional regulator [Sphingobacteriales bacterium]|jgi:Rrf2 family protein|nr:MAG: Rrf2 family transcriptional regulator [Sphingobacteriales bacterium]
MFSKTCEYGIKATIYIAGNSLDNKKVSLKDVAKAIESPEAYTSKILQELSRKEIIMTSKGPTGGFSMELKKIEKLNLCDIVSAIDGNSIYKSCGLGLKKCNEKMPCPVHHQFKKIRDDIKQMLETTSIKSLTSNLELGLVYLKR